MLWQKEMIDGEMLYAKLLTKSEERSFLKDFYQILQQCKSVKQHIIKKNNLVSQEARGEGNNLFNGGHFEEALYMYNRALMIAESTSEDLGIGYANRSACFLKLKRYKLCLADIELAKKNNCPTRLMPKLDRRKTECEKLLAAYGEAESQRAAPKLSFDADRKVPYFGDGLKVKFSEKHGNHIVTNRDLKIGQTIIVERAFVFDVMQQDIFCANCFKWAANFIPCEKCLISLFCSEECRTAAMKKFHNVICDMDMIPRGKGQFLAMKSIITAINIYSTVEALMDAVENFRTPSDNEITFDDPAQRDYFQFFTLSTKIEKLSPQLLNALKHQAVEVVEALTHVSGTRNIFRSKRIVQFLSHLVLHHLLIIVFNTCDATHGTSHRFNDMIGIDESANTSALGYGVAPYSSQINHSCAPNVSRIFINDTVVYKVLRPIKSGEQLFVSYLSLRNLLKPLHLRSSELANQHHFVCDCISCTSNWPPFQVTGKQTLDVLSCRLLAIFDVVPAKDVKELIPVTREELRKFEEAALNYLRKNDHLHPTMETLKMQYLLTQIWYLLMR